MENETLIKELWASDQASSLTNRAAREIERLNEEVKLAPHTAVAAIEVATKDDDCDGDNKEWIERAAEKYDSEEINVYGNAEVSVGEDGAWVQAWVFVKN